MLYGRKVQRLGRRSNDRSKAGHTLEGTYGAVLLALALILGGCGGNEAQEEQQDVKEEQQDVQEVQEDLEQEQQDVEEEQQDVEQEQQEIKEERQDEK